MFAPPYRPSKHQQSLPFRQERLSSRKRKRDDNADTEDDERYPPQPQATPRTGTTAFHPVNKTDPYYVAGHPREDPLPPAPFPHAAVKETKRATRPIDEELAALNPPLYVAPTAPEDSSTSLRRRHLDNLTTILHRCMLRGDWQRAYQAWSLLIRTEIAGRGIDVRWNGRWSIGAELLMRKHSSTNHNETQASSHAATDAEKTMTFSDAGFKLARNYYERLIIQYPYTRTSKETLNATHFYPALFNVWIYEVQHRSQLARKALQVRDADSEDQSSYHETSTEADASQVSAAQQIRINELDQALPIADRMDELFMSPPYDTDVELRRLRGMVARWIADLYNEAAAAGSERADHERALLEGAKAEAFSITE